jgi:hypothetical protein
MPRRPRVGEEVQLHSFFNLGARRRWVISAKHQLLYPREKPGTHCIGGWVGPRADLDGCGKSRPDRDSIPGRPARSVVAIPTDLSQPQSLRFVVEYEDIINK